MVAESGGGIIKNKLQWGLGSTKDGKSDLLTTDVQRLLIASF